MRLPAPHELEMQPRTVVWHWTGGSYLANGLDLASYHLLGQLGRLHDRAVPTEGVPLARNMRSLSGVPTYRASPERGYAAHAGGFNTRSIGVAACCMLGAEDFRLGGGGVAPGRYPLTLVQVRWLLATSASLARMYPSLLPVGVGTFCTHEEVYRVHGRGRAKWNITWLPGFDLSPQEVGPFLREQLQRWLASELIDDRLYVPPVGITRQEVLEGDEEP